MKLDTYRCDSCGVPESVPAPPGAMYVSSHLPPGWLRLILLEAPPADHESPVARTMGGFVEVLAEADLSEKPTPEKMRDIGQRMAKLIDRPKFDAPPALELCPSCAATLVVIVRGVSVLEALRRRDDDDPRHVDEASPEA